MSVNENAILKEFLLESNEGLSSISEELTLFEKSESKDNELINSIYRTVHTLKGSSSFLAFKKLEALAHSTETVLDHFREGDLIPSAEMIDLLLASFDSCVEIINVIEKTGKEPEQTYEKLSAQLESLLENELLGEYNSKSDNVIGFNEEVIVKQSIDEQSNREVEKDYKEYIKPKGESAQESTVSPQKSFAGTTVRVNVNLLDKILNVVGELVLNRNQILQLSNEKEEPNLSRLSHQLNVITTELQTDIMTTRMQPVSVVFNSFERITRDLARSQNKKVKLNLVGQETELDKTLLEHIKDPMVHLIRNAIDHGIEAPSERVKRQKNEAGELTIKTYHAGGQVVIEISDDGNGISPTKILEKAVSKGIISSEEAQTCSNQKALNFIFHPGFSTAEQITNISGRGVGMDVVKSNIEKIGGQCDISSTELIGTTFRLKIPLTLAIIPALIVKGADETFAIPQKNLIELVLIENDEGDEIEKICDSEFYRLRGQLIPVFRINECLDLENEKKKLNQVNIVVLQSENGVYGLIVDEILDTQEIVVKPLSLKLKTGSIYAGATIMGDGTVALILDALGLFSNVDQSNNKENITYDNLVDIDSSRKNKFDAEELLLFKLNDNRKYGIPLTMVSRLEEFHQDKIEVSGTQSLIRYRESAMPLILLNDEITYSLKNVDKSKADTKLEKPCIVSTVRGRNFGFVVDKIVDIGRSESAIEYGKTEDNKILGTTYIDDKIVTIIDSHQILENLNLLDSVQIKKGGPKILLVEDSKLYQRLVFESLEANGYDVTLAVNGKIGLDLLTEEKADFDLVITDIEMPEMNGFEMVNNIRKNNNKFKNIPIIAVTTRVSTEDLNKGKEIGINTHLEKLDNKQVLEAVEVLLNQQL